MALRISTILVQVILVQDDGEELTPGPELQPISVPLSKLAELADVIPAEIAALQARITNSPSA